MALTEVSVLFSEPKIPQYGLQRRFAERRIGFSALQRAENSSIYFRERDGRTAESVSVLFSEPKIPQCPFCACCVPNRMSFSALQRAENSSILMFAQL